MAATYSDSVEKRVTMACFFVRHAIAPPAKVNKKPDVDREKSTSHPQSSSVHPCSGVDSDACVLELSSPKYAL